MTKQEIEKPRIILLVIGTIIAIPGIFFSWGNIADRIVCGGEPCLSIFEMDVKSRSLSIIIGFYIQVATISFFSRYSVDMSVYKNTLEK